jgi:D-sedoheptulose 7-phosphate isomerase
MPEFKTFLEEHLEVAHQSASLLPPLETICAMVRSSFERGGKLLVFGNGGSAADAQHLAAELVGRYRRERRALSAIALTTDSSALTCIGNDYDFADVFKRQVEALCRPEDVVFGITTSGASENVARGLRAANDIGAVTVALTGGSGGQVATIADHSLIVPSSTTARIQEMHIFLIHLLCENLDDWVLEKDGGV